MGESWTCNDGEAMSELMSLALDGVLDADGEERLQRHLAHCPACQAEWVAMQQVSELFKEAPVAGPRLGFATRVERRLAEKDRQRRQVFGGVAVLTGSLSLAALTVATVAVVALGLVAWNWGEAIPDLKEGTTALSQLAAGIGLLSRGLRLFVEGLLLDYGLPVLLVVGACLLVLLGVWIWLVVKQPRSYEGNGYA
jgi:predicted anti-sigma-YlaC factor YlaD